MSYRAEVTERAADGWTRADSFESSDSIECGQRAADWIRYALMGKTGEWTVRTKSDETCTRITGTHDDSGYQFNVAVTS